MSTMTTSSNDKTASTRSLAPVFVLGCGRSGTTLLYHMLLSAGNFAVYRVESNVINLLEPRFGDLSVAANKRRLLEAWYDSRLYTLSGLDKEEIAAKVMSECRNGGDFLRIIMSEMARKQGVQRWADTTPEHLAAPASHQRNNTRRRWSFTLFAMGATLHFRPTSKDIFGPCRGIDIHRKWSPDFTGNGW